MSYGTDIASFLASELVDSYWVYGTTVFAGPVRPPSRSIPQRAIFVSVTGGLNSTFFKGGGKLVPVTVQIWNRASTFLQAETDAEAVHSTLDQSPPTGYVESIMDNSAPLVLPPDSEGNHQRSNNVTVIKREA